jgi:hypothetical protein
MKKFTKINLESVLHARECFVLVILFCSVLVISINFKNRFKTDILNNIKSITVSFT